MAAITLIQEIKTPAWVRMLANLLPLWLFSFCIVVEGFPNPGIPIGLAFFALAAGVVISIAALVRKWMPVELLIYNLMPFALMIRFDEISTLYKTPFILICTLILSTGALGYLSVQRRWLGWVFLALGAALTLGMTGFLVDQYWKLVSLGGYESCYPGCLPPVDQEHPWWLIFRVMR